MQDAIELANALTDAEDAIDRLRKLMRKLGVRSGRAEAKQADRLIWNLNVHEMLYGPCEDHDQLRRGTYCGACGRLMR